MVKIKSLLLALLMVLNGCAVTPQQERQALRGFPYWYDGFDFKVAWKTTPTPQGAALDLMMQNIRYQRIEDTEVTVSLTTARNEKLAETMTFPLPRPLRLDDYSQFSLLLKNVPISPGDLLRFVIRYQVIEGRREAFSWMTTFTADAVTGAILVPPGEENK